MTTQTNCAHPLQSNAIHYQPIAIYFYLMLVLAILFQWLQSITTKCHLIQYMFFLGRRSPILIVYKPRDPSRSLRLANLLPRFSPSPQMVFSDAARIIFQQKGTS
jgi:hypothetical protein